MTRQYPPSSETGSTLLFISGFIFLCALGSAAFTWYYFNRPFTPSPATLPSPTPVASGMPADVLNPTTHLDPAVVHEEATLQKNLIAPLRRYYATQSERLTEIRVKPSDDETHPFEVSLVVRDAEKNDRTLSFLYDLTVWNPTFLDNQP